MKRIQFWFPPPQDLPLRLIHSPIPCVRFRLARSVVILIAIVLTLGLSMPGARAQPALQLAVTNQLFILSWTNNNGTNCALQSAADLIAPNWLTATDAIPVNYSYQISAAVTNSSSARFFRLAPTPPAADGMAFIPAGWLTLGNTIGDTDTDSRLLRRWSSCPATTWIPTS